MIRIDQKIFARLRNLKTQNKGFTIVEVLFTAIIGLLVMGMFMILNVGVRDNMTLGVTLAEINSDARLTIDRIVRDVRWATQVETSRNISGTNYVTADDELVIQIPSIDGSGDILAGSFDYVVYALDPSDNTVMRMIVDPDGSSSRSSLDQIIAENIGSFTLSSNGTGLSSVGSLSTVSAVEISLMVTKTPLQNKTISETISSEVELRNN